MLRSTNRIKTSHVGSLPRPADLLAMNTAKQRGGPHDATARAARVKTAVKEVVQKQAETGIDCINDGEFSKLGFLLYAQDRLTGFQPEPAGPSFMARRDWAAFKDFYEEWLRGTGWSGGGLQPICVGPITYCGQDLVKEDIANLKAALQGVKAEEAFMTAISPGTFGRGQNHYYRTEEEFLFAISEAMRHEYKAIVDAGFILQIDDPGLPDTWDMVQPPLSVEEYREYAMLRIEALNHGLAGLPADRIRYHVCWGSWPGPHTTDIPLRDIVDLMLKVNARTFSVEAANVRHEHEWKVWRDTKLPDGAALMPGVVSHSTNVIEHTELVADRLIRYANLVGRENVIAGTDCGLGGRLHPQIAWAKLQALCEGAALASKQLWR